MTRLSQKRAFKDGERFTHAECKIVYIYDTPTTKYIQAETSALNQLTLGKVIVVILI